MKLTPQDLDLVGAWNMKGAKVVGDAACDRIEWLVANQLIQLGSDSSGWSELYRDPDDDRLWELTWPQSEIHGGGPPRLTCLSLEQARGKYGTLVDS